MNIFLLAEIAYDKNLLTNKFFSTLLLHVCSIYIIFILNKISKSEKVFSHRTNTINLLIASTTSLDENLFL